jgi:hypothetical protein
MDTNNNNNINDYTNQPPDNNDHDDNKVIAAISYIGGFIVVGLFITYMVALWSWNVHSFWNWFIAPIFPQLNPITYLQGIGIFLFTLLIGDKSIVNVVPMDSFGSYAKALAIMPLTIYFIGLIVHLIMINMI